MTHRNAGKLSVLWIGGFAWGLWALASLGAAACGGGDGTSQGQACQGDEDCPWGTCNQNTHQCESQEGVDAGSEQDSGNQEQDAGSAVDASNQDQDGQVAECSSDEDCRDPKQPICDAGSCRGCGDDSECSERWPDRSTCDAGRCIGVCGNGRIDSGEECDSQDFGSATCASETGLGEGSLSCTADCHLDSSGCHQCGNGTLEGGEECDGQDFGSATCASETGLGEGSLSCTADCHLDSSGCHQCGNGTLEGGETCDGADLQGHSCQDFGFALGDLACASDCMSFDQDSCTNCGNGTCDDGETTSSCPQDCGWVDLAAGKDVACGIKADGTVWCWGNNSRGQMGIGTWGSLESSPVQVHNISDVIRVSVGGDHVCAVTANAGYYCWGNNQRYQIRTDYSPVKMEILPYDMQAATLADGLVAGGQHTCRGLRSGFSQNMVLYCRGDNQSGQIGNGSTSNMPVGTDSQVPGGFTKVFTSTLDTQCATTHYFSTSQGRFVDEVRCWGYNEWHQASPDSTDTYVTSPALISDVEGVDGGCGDQTCCAMSAAGAVMCWGNNTHLARGSQSVFWTPNLVPWSQSFAGLTVGAFHVCAWEGDGDLVCWGNNDHYQSLPNTAQPNMLPTMVPLPGNESVSKAAAGAGFTCFLTDSRRIYCWGANDKGQTGTGQVSDQVDVPTEVVDPNGQ